MNGRRDRLGRTDTKTRQARKHSIGMAGEFLVAGELLRRGLMAAVTYGNAKRADVVAFHEGRSTTVEVKSTSESRWVLGGSLPEDSSSLWVLVHLPVDEAKAPEYFVLTSAELRGLVRPGYDSYMERYRQKHGKEYSGAGVVSVQREQIDDKHLGAWHKVIAALVLEQREPDEVRVPAGNRGPRR